MPPIFKGETTMLFSSITFLYYFLPVVIIAYFAAPKRFKNAVLLLSSLVFYAWGEPAYVYLMIFSVTANYVLGFCIEKKRGKWQSKFFAALSLAFSLGALGYFKYADFFIANINAVTGASLPLLRIALPIGISFYTFQMISYIIDVYRGDVAAQKNPITLGTYIALFPQLIAGPIVRYSDVEKQLSSRTHSVQKCAEGIRRFVLGLGKKVIIANTLGELCASFGASGDKSVAFFWLFALSYMLQIYFDFSGYSDMAIGLGKVFGFDFMENFRYPFVSASITEFWRRWHISLGSWFRDYVYIPLGGNRKGKIRHILNIFVVWFLTGFWHGAEWNFALWGLYFAVLLLMEKYIWGAALQKTKVTKHIYVIFFALVSFVIFSASDLGGAFGYVGAMFGGGDYPVLSDAFLYNLRNYGFAIILACVFSTPLFVHLKALAMRRKSTRRMLRILETPALAAIFVVATAYLVDGSFNPFLYFRF